MFLGFDFLKNIIKYLYFWLKNNFEMNLHFNALIKLMTIMVLKQL